MSFSSSRWNSTKQQNNNNNPASSPSSSSSSSPSPSTETAAAAKYLPPHLKPKSNPARHNVRKPSSDIVISPQDRILSKKFSKPPSNIIPSHTHNHQNEPKIIGLINSFDRSIGLNSHPDPMSLTPSLSRGINRSPKIERIHQETKNITTNRNLKKDDEGGSEGGRVEDDAKDSFEEEQDLMNLKFQIEFFKWIIKKLNSFRPSSSSNSIQIFLNSITTSINFNQKTSDDQVSSLNNDRDLKSQLDRISSLVRELRKLREGIYASGRSDSFAIVVYETSAELALESADFVQLNMILNHLVFGLYKNQMIEEHLLMKSNTSMNLDESDDLLDRSTLESTIVKEKTKPEDAVMRRFMDRHRSDSNEILNRRLMFARVLLLLPIVNRFDLSRFIDQFSQINQIFNPQRSSSLSSKSDSNHTNNQEGFHRIVLGISTYHSKLFELGQFYKFLIRRNFFELNRRFIKPELLKILEFQQLYTKKIMNNDLSSNRSLNAFELMIQWDQFMFLKFLNLFRIQLVWKIIQKSYYSLSSKDDLFIFKSLCLEFSLSNPSSHYHPNPSPHSDLHPNSCLLLQNSNYPQSVHHTINDWLIHLGLHRSSDGSVQLKQPKKS